MSKGGQRQRAKSDARNWRNDFADTGRQIGKVLLSHPSAFLAYAGVGLYVIGLVRTVGILQAENIPITRGLPLAPLQDYLVRGLAVVITPQTFIYIVFLGLAVFFVAAELVPRIVSSDVTSPTDADLKTEASAGSRDSAGASSSDWLSLIPLPVVLGLIAIVVLVPVAQWLPILPGTAAATWAFFTLMDMTYDPTNASAVRFATYVTVMLGSLFLAWAMHAYFHPSPLDIATISPKEGKPWKASVLYSTDQVLYVVGRKDEESGNRQIKEVPIEDVQSVEILDGPPRNFNTVADLLGIRLWRYTEPNGKPRIERSPSNLEAPWDRLKPPWEWSLP